MASDDLNSLDVTRMSGTTALVCWRDGSSAQKGGTCALLATTAISGASNTITKRSNDLIVSSRMIECGVSGSSDVGAFDLRATSVTTTSAMVCFTWADGGAGHARVAGCVAVGWTGALILLSDELGPNPVVSSTFEDINSDGGGNLRVMGTSLSAFTDTTTDSLNSTSRAVYCYESISDDGDSHWLGKNLTCAVLSISMDEFLSISTCKFFCFLTCFSRHYSNCCFLFLLPLPLFSHNFSQVSMALEANLASLVLTLCMCTALDLCMTRRRQTVVVSLFVFLCIFLSFIII